MGIGGSLRTEITGKGLKVLSSCNRSVTRMETERMADVTPAQRDELLEALLSCVRRLCAG